VPDFTSADLKASRFTDVDLTDGRFRSLLLSGATFARSTSQSPSA
jgi:uncharacterized protein YjbI with pentapeptide repeats